MTLAQLASVIMERRRTTPGFSIQSGVLVSELGQQAFEEALQRRWLVPDIHSGMGGLSITDEATRVREMEEAMTDPNSMDTGDEGQYVGSNGRIYPVVVRNVSADRTKATLAFPQGRPPGDRDGVEYDIRDVKVTKKTTPDARKNPNTPPPTTPPSPPTSPSAPPTNTYSGLAH